MLVSSLLEKVHILVNKFQNRCTFLIFLLFHIVGSSFIDRVQLVFEAALIKLSIIFAAECLHSHIRWCYGIFIALRG